MPLTRKKTNGRCGGTERLFGSRTGGGGQKDGGPPEHREQEDDTAASDTAKEKDKELEKIIAERERIEQENQRKLDEYQEALKKGRESVKDLNLRFGDWYFVVADEVFQKVRLSRDNVVKKKEKPKAEGEAATKSGESESAAPGGASRGCRRFRA